MNRFSLMLNHRDLSCCLFQGSSKVGIFVCPARFEDQKSDGLARPVIFCLFLPYGCFSVTLACSDDSSDEWLVDFVPIDLRFNFGVDNFPMTHELVTQLRSATVRAARANMVKEYSSFTLILIYVIVGVRQH